MINKSNRASYRTYEFHAIHMVDHIELGKGGANFLNRCHTFETNPMKQTQRSIFHVHIPSLYTYMRAISSVAPWPEIRTCLLWYSVNVRIGVCARTTCSGWIYKHEEESLSIASTNEEVRLQWSRELRRVVWLCPFRAYRCWKRRPQGLWVGSVSEWLVWQQRWNWDLWWSHHRCRRDRQSLATKMNEQIAECEQACRCLSTVFILKTRTSSLVTLQQGRSVICCFLWN